MKLDKNYKVRVSPEQRRKIHSLILLDGGEVSYGLKPQLQDEFLVIENEHGSVVIYYTDQDIFLSAEQQEIQADDLIALLTDLSKSAENPPQNMKLTPEFEAVEPKFKVGDKVYCLLLEPKIFTILEVDGDNDNDVQFAGEFGWASGYSCCHANQENYDRLQAIFPRIEFERPPKPLSGDELVKAMLTKGIKNVLCFKNGTTDKVIIDRLCYEGSLMTPDCVVIGGVTPIDWHTGEPLTESALDE